MAPLEFALSFVVGLGLLYASLSLLERLMTRWPFAFLLFLPLGTILAFLVAAVPVALVEAPDWALAITMSLAEAVVVVRTIHIGRKLGWRRMMLAGNRRAFRVVILLASGLLIIDALVPGHSGQSRLFDVVTVALYLGLAQRLLRMGVQVEPDGVLIRNAVGRRRLLWSDIHRFELGRFGRFKKGTLAAARLRDGRMVRIDGSPFDVLATRGWFRDLIHGRNPTAQVLVDRLNQELREHGG